ncbi:hypothetical protein H9L15_03535 [Sphingomonas daechungensis]|uniref:Transposase n=1 Tax=Sphingomonas daechungensis TaxID=1176646 RepID=A0ABX6T4V7_9SPHN|nr:hypothetical protein [Sphingomonas daechungensis]QNP43748.1 hypothetical protein H9L15_03535 [Sphingomonas daechungensis]
MSADLLKDWSTELVRLIDEDKSDAAAGDDFAKGRKFGLGEALSLLQQEARAFGIDAASIGLPRRMA